jgi:hypothetical protein
MRETYEGDLKNLDSEIVMNNSSRMEFYER